MTGTTHDLAIFWLVVAGRFFVPLLIPRFPLPAVVAALVLDGVDQSIFQQFTTLNLDGYQSYDKALDVYYLSIAYISTMRNWRNTTAFHVSRFLFYYRLAGVMLFETFGQRWLLLVFPNTFEYFFIAIEVIRLRWDPVRLSRRFLIALAAFIWIVIKLPQEWWIHIAQLDLTDTLKTMVFGVETTASWATALTNRPAVTIGILLLAVGLVALVRYVVWPRLPAPDPADRRGLAADPVPAPVATAARRAAELAREGHRLWTIELLEQVVLITLVCAIFASMLPGVEVRPVAMTVGIAILVVLNAAFGLWSARRGHSIESTLGAFGALMVVDIAFLVLTSFVFGFTYNRSAMAVFLVLLVLIVVLYARYRPVLDYRTAHGLMDDAARQDVAG